VFYSPIIIRNKTDHIFNFILNNNKKKKTEEFQCFIDKNGMMCIPHGYLDGILYFIDQKTNDVYHTINLMNGMFDNDIIYFKEDIIVNKKLKVTISKNKHQVLT